MMFQELIVLKGFYLTGPNSYHSSTENYFFMQIFLPFFSQGEGKKKKSEMRNELGLALSFFKTLILRQHGDWT